MTVRLPAWVANAILVFAHVYWGAGYAFGPARFTASRSYTYVLDWAPAILWGWWFLGGALLTAVAPWLIRWGSGLAHVLASLPLAAFSVALIAAQVAGLSEGWGGVIAYLLIIALHGLLVAARFAPDARRA